MEEKLFYLGFSLFPGIGSVKFSKLLTTFATANDAWNADAKDLAAILGNALTEKFTQFKKTIDLQKEFENLSKKDIMFFTPEEKEYPKLLRELPHHPFVLYVKGNVENLNAQKTIGIVGTRKISSYGREVTELFTQEFVQGGFITVSGLAFGVDALVHSKTIENGGKTVAVLGCGVDCCTPSSNQQIYNRILTTGGTIISTFSPGLEANKGSFPARNAIIAGLSLGILVTEGAADSGALITAEYAKKFNRPVFAVPGPITSALSKGPNSLIQKGAIPVTDTAQILDRLGIMGTQKGNSIGKRQSSDIPEEQSVLDILETNPLHFDEIVRTIGKSTKEVGSLLTLMELKGLIKNNGGVYSI